MIRDLFVEAQGKEQGCQLAKENNNNTLVWLIPVPFTTVGCLEISRKVLACFVVRKEIGIIICLSICRSRCC